MKRFFKPTAILIGIATMFCACVDDGTEDVVSSSLGESEIRVVYPGYCQAWVKWVMPEDANVSSCQLSWVNDEGTSSGAATLDAETGWMEVKLTDLPSGTYNFSLQNFTKTGTGSTINTYDGVVVYDDNTYADVFPTLTLSANSSGSYIDWSNVHEDCIGAYITYTDSDEKEVTTELTSLESQTIITDAKSCSQVTYVACFCPSFEYLGSTCTGLDIMSTTCDVKYAFPDAQPTSPSEVLLSPGTNKLKIGWYTPQIIDITYVDIVIDGPGFSDQDTIRLSTSGVPIETSSLGTSVVGTFSKGVISELLLINSEDYDAIGGDEVVSKYHDASNSASSYSPLKNSANEIEAGEYTVTLYTVKGLTGTYSEPSTATITVYDQTETYTHHPAVGEISYDGTDARIEWATSYESNGESIEVVDCIGVEVTYPTAASSGDETATTTMSAVDVAVDMPGVYYTSTESGGVETPTSTFTYQSYFCPENGLDVLSIVNTDATNIIPFQSPTKPSNVAIYPSDNAIYVYCDLANDSFIDGLRFTYYSADGSEILATEDLEVKNLNLGEENEFSLTGTVVVGTTYVVGIQTYNNEYSNTSAMQLFENIEIYDYASFVATCAAPTIESYSFDNTTCRYTIVWDAPSSGDAEVEFTYVYTAYGDTKTVYLTDLTANGGEMVFTDLMPGSTYSYITRFSPVENAMDVLEYNPVEATLTDEYVYKTWTEYPMLGSIYCNNVDTNGVTNTQWAFADLWNENYQKTAASGTANYEFGAASPGTEGIVEVLAFGQTICIDLGNTYTLSRFAFHFFIAGTWSVATKDFALYGTAYEDPVNNDNYNKLNSDGATPDLTYWDLLLDATAQQPSTYNIDWNGDGVVNTTDDDDILWGGLDADGYADGSAICFDITNPVPVRYFKIQINSTYSTTATTPNIRLQEIDLWQAGFVSDEWNE